jgi:hypothetical protein
MPRQPQGQQPGLPPTARLTLCTAPPHRPPPQACAADFKARLDQLSPAGSASSQQASPMHYSGCAGGSDALSGARGRAACVRDALSGGSGPMLQRGGRGT